MAISSSALQHEARNKGENDSRADVEGVGNMQRCSILMRRRGGWYQSFLYCFFVLSTLTLLSSADSPSSSSSFSSTSSTASLQCIDHDFFSSSSPILLTSASGNIGKARSWLEYATGSDRRYIAGSEDLGNGCLHGRTAFAMVNEADGLPPLNDFVFVWNGAHGEGSGGSSPSEDSLESSSSTSSSEEQSVTVMTEFQLLMLDFGDYRPYGYSSSTVKLTAFDEDGEVVAEDSVTAQGASYAQGDACAAADDDRGKPGHFRFFLQSDKGIARVKMTFSTSGGRTEDLGITKQIGDPNTAWTNICFRTAQVAGTAGTVTTTTTATAAATTTPTTTTTSSTHTTTTTSTTTTTTEELETTTTTITPTTTTSSDTTITTTEEHETTTTTETASTLWPSTTTEEVTTSTSTETEEPTSTTTTTEVLSTIMDTTTTEAFVTTIERETTTSPLVSDKPADMDAQEQIENDEESEGAEKESEKSEPEEGAYSATTVVGAVVGGTAAVGAVGAAIVKTGGTVVSTGAAATNASSVQPSRRFNLPSRKKLQDREVGHMAPKQKWTFRSPRSAGGTEAENGGGTAEESSGGGSGGHAEDRLEAGTLGAEEVLEAELCQDMELGGLNEHGEDSSLHQPRRLTLDPYGRERDCDPSASYETLDEEV